MTHTALTLRALTPQDEAAWRSLWRAYLEFYQTTRPDEVYSTTFARLTSGAEGEFRGILAEREGEALGLAHYLCHRSCWSVANVCYLQDLFTVPAARGLGVGRALIGAVYAAADAAGAPDVYWLTAENNYRGRALYDSVGVRTPFIEYNRV
jgi:GNAT superfamily N-acetyltransferase